eukprot:TRINITY_DN7060_c0_g1_i2.p1 TRINITY_DN7060_c0_g1~~TRINITY_DN7060_c0_g1_i2.p1  ORF type:complete len:362 (+),score=78.73 TRINITY_DN7060_c0_g1_i2:408-1493(+)
MLYLLRFSNRGDAGLAIPSASGETQHMLRFAEKVARTPGLASLSPAQLVNFAMSEHSAFMVSASNLLVSALLHRADNPSVREDEARHIISLVTASSNTSLGRAELLGAVLASFSLLFDRSPAPVLKTRQGEIIHSAFATLRSKVDVPHCVHCPEQVALALKVLGESVKLYRGQLEPQLKAVFKQLSLVYFLYYFTTEYVLERRDAFSHKLGALASEVDRQDEELKKTMRLLSMKTLLLLGGAFPAKIVEFLQSEISDMETHFLYPGILLEILKGLVRRHSAVMMPHLVTLVEMILRCLDPNNPTMRKNCHKFATNALHAIFKTYSAVSFHQNTQRFALASPDNLIVIYDLRTAVKLSLIHI